MTGTNVLIGVATTVIPRRRQGAGRSIVRPTRFYCSMAKVAAEHGASVILFAPDDIDFRQGRVKGYCPAVPEEAFGNWHAVETRLPDVIYENVFVHLAIAGKTSSLRRQARGRQIPLFNPPFPSKWQFHRMLKDHPLSAHLPVTETYQSAERTVSRVDAWGSAYLKPIGGYGGMGVTRIERLGANRYRYATDRSGTTGGKSRRELTRTALIQTLRQRILRSYLVQQEIPAMRLDWRKLDFRVVVQRGRGGHWKVTAVIPKMAAAHGVVTNIIAGGERLTLAACQKLATQAGKTLKVEALEQLALELSKWIAQRIPKVGIIGYDLALDEQGRAWLIEANPKPARSLLHGTMVQRSAKQCAEFSIYLANQRRAKT